MGVSEFLHDGLDTSYRKFVDLLHWIFERVTIELGTVLRVDDRSGINVDGDLTPIVFIQRNRFIVKTTSVQI
jgi:hypothetical protein